MIGLWRRLDFYFLFFLFPSNPTASPPPRACHEGSGFGVGARVRALGVDADEHVRRLGLLHFPKRGAHHDRDLALRALAREDFMGPGRPFRRADTPWLFEGTLHEQPA